MKRLFLWWILFSMVFTTSFEKVYAVCEMKNSNLKDFGYYSIEGISGTNVDIVLNDFATMGNSNVFWLNAQFTPETMQPLLEKYKAKNIKPLIQVRWIFFSGNGDLKTNWESLWNSFLTSIVGYEDYIYGFYIDEPMWNKYSETAFRSATKTIKDRFPSKKILIIEAGPPIYGGNLPINPTYYEYVTDIGVDFYISQLNGTVDENWAKYMTVFNKVKNMFPNKKLWLIPDGTSNLNDKDKYKLIDDMFEKYVCLANQNSQIVGMMNFIYSSNGTTMVGLKDLIDLSGRFYNKDFRTRQIEVGKWILANNHNVADVVVGDYNKDGKVDLSDFGSWKIEYLAGRKTLVDFGLWKARYLK